MSSIENKNTLKSECFYKSLFANNQNIMLVIDPETSEIVDCNSAACDFYGYSYDDMLKLKITDFNLLTKEQVFQEMSLAKAEKRNYFYFQHRLSNGQIRDVQVSSTPMNLDGKDLLFSIISDTTNLKIYNDKLKAENIILEKTATQRMYKLEETNVILDKANNILSAIIESSPEVIVFALDCNYCYLAFNKKHKDTMKSIWGKEIQIGMNMLDVIGTHVDHKKAKKNFDRALAGESFVMIEEFGDEKLSRLYWQDFWSPIYSTKGNVMGLTCFVLNVTSSKQMENALKESEERKRLLISQMQQGLAVHEMLFDESGKAVDYRFLDVNESFERLTGLKHEKIIGKTVLEVLPGTESYWIKKYGHVAVTGEPLHYENYAKELGKYFEITAYSPQHNKFAVIMSDITKRKKLEASFTNEKKLLETTLRSIGDGVISTDNKGNIIFLNTVTELLTGWTQEEAIGKSIEEVFNIFHEFTREKCENIVTKVLESKKTLALANHTILISKDGTERPIEDSAAPIVQENGEIIGVVLVFRDVTEEKERQREILYLSYHDQLTGLYNRRFYEEELKRLDTERNLPISIVMGDVNGLKLINDSFGHVMGDELIKKVAEVITKGCRADDIIARLGGDEFVIVLPKTDSFETEQIIKRINELSLKEKVGSINISVSFGYETKNLGEEKIQDVFKKAEDYMYKKKLFESPSMRGRTINAIITTLHEKNKREELHSHRVSRLCKSMGEALGLPEYEMRELETVGLLHDIGKIAIDEDILNKPGKLSDNEWEEIRRHPEIGYRILNTVNDMSEMSEYVLAHHERWDGKGYPRGLIGNEIPFMSRIIAIADAYDAMTSERSYRSFLPQDVALEELQKNAGAQFDPELVKIFIENVLGKNSEA